MRAPFVVIVALGCAGAPRVPTTTVVVPPESATAATASAKVADRDGDGIADAHDKCPDHAEDRDGFEDADGCPDPDNDRDGIADADDKCPNEPETYNGFQDEDGCPDKSAVVITSNPPAVVERVTFAKNGAKPVAAAKVVLDAVVAVMKGHPEVELVQLEGHADADEKSPLDLAQKRADAIRAHLIDAGIDGGRLRAKGLGAYCPTGKENRRVDFKVVTSSGKPTGVELGCEAATKAGI